MIQQKAVLVNDVKVEDTNTLVALEDKPTIIKAGKRKFFKVAAKKSF